MFKRYFKNFDFRGFKDFIYDLLKKYGFWNIQFYPDKREYFSDIQLCHVAPNSDFNNSNGFAQAWMKKQREVRRVSFDFWRQDNSAKISMTINLDKKYISLDKIEGNISSVQVEDAIKDNLKTYEKGLKNKMLVGKVLKNIWEIFVGVIIVVAGAILVYYVFGIK